MNYICGTVDFSANISDLNPLIEMWKSLAPLGRGYTYAHGGVALACERAPSFSATHFLPSGKSIAAVLGAPCEGLFAEDLLFVYETEGLSALCSFAKGVCFALCDQKQKLLVISAADEPVFFAQKEKKIIFASKKEALSLINQELPYSAVKISPYGFALYSMT